MYFALVINARMLDGSLKINEVLLINVNSNLNPTEENFVNAGEIKKRCKVLIQTDEAIFERGMLIHVMLSFFFLHLYVTFFTSVLLYLQSSAREKGKRKG